MLLRLSLEACPRSWELTDECRSWADGPQPASRESPCALASSSLIGLRGVATICSISNPGPGPEFLFLAVDRGP